MYLADDPRSQLAPAGRTGSAPRSIAQPGARFAAAQYARFGQSTPQVVGETEATWLARGQNFVVAYTQAQPGARLERRAHPDEYVLLVPERDVEITVSVGRETLTTGGHCLVIIPPGRSTVAVKSAGTVIRIFSSASSSLNALASNAAAYAEAHPHIPPYVPWPAPPEGFRLRSYDLDVPPETGRFGRIWRCSTLMVNVHPLEPGPRDLSRLSPHHHEDFEQGSLALKGSFTHHVRWPWTPDIRDWRPDDHEVCPAPSLAVIPPPAIHTSAGTDQQLNHLVDIFSPPRRDFSKMAGWVLNAQEYPMPPEPAAV